MVGPGTTQTPSVRSSITRGMRALLLVEILLIPGFSWGETDRVPFEWDDEFSSPGTSLSIQIESVMGQPPNGTVAISMKSTGFADSESNLVLWWNRGGEFSRTEVSLGGDGTAQVRGAAGTVLFGYLRGEPYDIALVDEASNRRAHAKIVPFPIEATGNGDCKASAELQSPSGRLWTVFLAGYQPGEAVEVTSATKKETLRDEIKASDKGMIRFPVLYPKNSKGRGSIRAEGAEGCSVTIDYAIGKAAVKAK